MTNAQKAALTEKKDISPKSIKCFSKAVDFFEAEVKKQPVEVKM